MLLLRLLSVVVLVGLSVIVQRQPTQACECAEGIKTTEAEVDRSLLVFRGVVTSFDQDERGRFEVGFQVATVWKGPVSAEITVWSSGGNTCGYIFQVGVEYLVFVEHDGQVTVCGLTDPVDQTSRIIDQLGEGKAPERDNAPPVRLVPERPDPPEDNTWIYVVLGIGIWGSLMSVVWFAQWRRRRKSRTEQTVP